ncbi:MAG TPA: hypothetical protein VHB51_01920 [Candidatus Saccharimonadales bacterium]|nr:hypothetical protein [Candidatus Saccharimonadales bacterium]
MAPKPAPSEHKTDRLRLPILVASTIDIGRLQRELEMLDDYLRQLELRQPGQTMKLPRTSSLLDQLAQLNKLHLLKAEDRQKLTNFLTDIKANAPVLHISFSVDPQTAFIEKLMAWLRLEIHPEVLITIGLQPTLGAGCVVRTTNKYFDFSLREDFANKRQLLADELAVALPSDAADAAPKVVA